MQEEGKPEPPKGTEAAKKTAKKVTEFCVTCLKLILLIFQNLQSHLSLKLSKPQALFVSSLSSQNHDQHKKH